jgi:hypothetical protein
MNDCSPHNGNHSPEVRKKHKKVTIHCQKAIFCGTDNNEMDVKVVLDDKRGKKGGNSPTIAFPLVYKLWSPFTFSVTTK